MTDILARLRDPLAANTYGDARKLLDEAANEIERLQRALGDMASEKTRQSGTR